MASAGAGKKFLETVNLQALISAQAQTKLLSPEERQAIGKARQDLAAGLPLSLDPALLTKAVTLKALDKNALGAY